MLRISFRYSDGQIQCNRKLDGAEEEVNYCTDSACTNYLDIAKKMSIMSTMSYVMVFLRIY